ncbi:MAG: hypothetical protein U0165_07225 [Polyangiaceae bacterium]
MRRGPTRRAPETQPSNADSLTSKRSARTDNRCSTSKSGEEHYNVASALIKSLRGSDPDAALYWMFRMLEAGDDPLFVARRLMIFASEDIGNADPRALDVAVAADAAFRRMGMPEGAYPLSQACLYLACAPKSDGVKRAMKRAREAIERHGALPVPMKLRNAPTSLMRDEGYGSGYRNPHAFEDHVAHGESYLPDELEGERFYEPPEIGFEKSIAERLDRLRGPRRLALPLRSGRVPMHACGSCRAIPSARASTSLATPNDHNYTVGRAYVVSEVDDDGTFKARDPDSGMSATGFAGTMSTSSRPSVGISVKESTTRNRHV